MNSNEIIFQAWEVTRDVRHRYVLSVRDDRPALIPFNRDVPLGSESRFNEAETRGFETYELLFCTNTR